MKHTFFRKPLFFFVPTIAVAVVFVASQVGAQNAPPNLKTWPDVAQSVESKYEGLKSVSIEGRYFIYKNSTARREVMNRDKSKSGGDFAYIPVDGNSVSAFKWVSLGDRWSRERYRFYPLTDDFHWKQSFDGEKFSSYMSLTGLHTISPTFKQVFNLIFIYNGSMKDIKTDPMIGTSSITNTEQMLFGKSRELIKYEGEREVDGMKLSLFTIDNDQVSAQFYFSEKNRLIVRSTAKWKLKDGFDIQHLVMSNFKDYSGISLPSQIKQEYYHNRSGKTVWQQTSVLTFDSVKVNDPGMTWEFAAAPSLGQRVYDQLEGDVVMKKGQVSVEDLDLVKRGIPPQTEEGDALVEGEASDVLQFQKEMELKFIGQNSR